MSSCAITVFFAICSARVWGPTNAMEGRPSMGPRPFFSVSSPSSEGLLFAAGGPFEPGRRPFEASTQPRESVSLPLPPNFRGILPYRGGGLFAAWAARTARFLN